MCAHSAPPDAPPLRRLFFFRQQGASLASSFRELWERAHPNSALRRRFPTGASAAHAADVRREIAYDSKFPRKALTNTGFPDDYDLLPPNWQEVLWDLGVSLPKGHPFAPVVDGKEAA